jgi:pimeloyl-ACP methyl ester carboxylesterase
MEIAAAYPEIVQKLVMSGPIYIDAKMRGALEGYFSQWHMQPDGSHLSKLWQSRQEWIPNPALVQRCIVDVMKSGETSENAYMSVANYPMEERLPLVQCPVMLIVGKKDPFVYPENYKPFKKILPNAKEVLLEEGALFIPDELPGIFSGLVTEFIDDG